MENASIRPRRRLRAPEGWLPFALCVGIVGLLVGFIHFTTPAARVDHTPPPPPKPQWTDIMRLITTPGLITAETVERTLRVKLSRHEYPDSPGAYTAGFRVFSHGRDTTAVWIHYGPLVRRGKTEGYQSSVDIYPDALECVSPARLDYDFAAANMVLRFRGTFAGMTQDTYSLGEREFIEVTYPPIARRAVGFTRRGEPACVYRIAFVQSDARIPGG